MLHLLKQLMNSAKLHKFPLNKKGEALNVALEPGNLVNGGGNSAELERGHGIPIFEAGSPNRNPQGDQFDPANK